MATNLMVYTTVLDKKSAIFEESLNDALTNTNKIIEELNYLNNYWKGSAYDSFKSNLTFAIQMINKYLNEDLTQMSTFLTNYSSEINRLEESFNKSIF